MTKLSKALRELAMTYCHYAVLRMYFRAVVMASVKDEKFLAASPCADHT